MKSDSQTTTNYVLVTTTIHAETNIFDNVRTVQYLVQMEKCITVHVTVQPRGGAADMHCRTSKSVTEMVYYLEFNTSWLVTIIIY